MPNYTENYRLEKPLPQDFYNVDVQNNNMDTIDTALHSLNVSKETPSGAQKKADQAKNAAIAACRPISWMPTASDIGAAGLNSSTGTVPLSQLPVLPLVVTTSGSGNAYTATIAGITTLTPGLLITIIPHTTSTSTSPTLNLNNLGAKQIQRRSVVLNNRLSGGPTNNWLAYNIPQILQYHSGGWIAVDFKKPSAFDFDGTVLVTNGGTGKSTWIENRIPYPSSSTELSQIAFPSTAGSFLRQGTSGAPYWTAPENVQVGTATKLATARTINGIAFDGTKNISTPANSVNGFTFAVSDAAPTSAPAGRITFVYEGV